MELPNIVDVLEDVIVLLEPYAEFKKCMISLQKGLERIQSPMRILVMGEFSTGKSTFINAFLGKDIFIRDTLPTTAIITKITYGIQKGITIHYKNGDAQSIQDNTLLREITAEDASGNVKNSIRSDIDYVRITAPIDSLKNMEFIDSPGLSADNMDHTNITTDYIPEADVIFWIINIQHAGRSTEFQTIHSLPERLKPVIILNQIDIVDEDEQIDAVVEQLRRNLKSSVQKIFPLSAQDALEGKLNHDMELVSESRFTALENYVKQVLTPNAGMVKGRSVLSELANCLAELGVTLQAQEHDAVQYRQTDYQQFIEKRAFVSNIKQRMFKSLHPFMIALASQRDSMDNIVNKLIGLSVYFGLGNQENQRKGISILEGLTEKDECTVSVLWQYYVPKDDKMAIKWAKQLVIYKRKDAAAFLANIYGNTKSKVYNLSQALHWSKMAADMGEGMAQLAYALYCYTGKGIDKNYNVAFRYFQQARKQHITGVAYWLGQCYELGHGVEPDDAKMFKAYHEAVLEGNMRAIKSLGLCYKNGKGTKTDYLQAAKYFQEIVDIEPDIAFDLGECYFKYGELQYQQRQYQPAIEWLQKAVHWKYPQASRTLAEAYVKYGETQQAEQRILSYEKAIELGKSDLKGELGLLYAKGPYNIRNIRKAIELCREAAIDGNPKAMVWLAQQYEIGSGVAKDIKKATDYYIEASKLDDKDALNWLAWQYYRGNNTFTKDYEKAAIYFRKAGGMQTNATYERCAMDTAEKYFYGKDIAVDYGKAVEWYKEAAVAGNTGAMNQVGYCYDRGKGVARDVDLAFEYFQKAAKQGHAIAQSNVGLYYVKGIGVTKNEKLSFQWIQKAAEQGYAHAQYTLGQYYQAGIGTPKDSVKAIEWYSRAADCDDVDALVALGDYYSTEKQYSFTPTFGIYIVLINGIILTLGKLIAGGTIGMVLTILINSALLYYIAVRKIRVIENITQIYSNAAELSNKENIKEKVKRQEQRMKTWYIVGLIIVTIAFCSCLVFWNMNDKNTVYYQRMHQEEMIAANANSELSLNGVSLGDSWGSVKEKWGKPISPGDESPGAKYVFKDVEVSVNEQNEVILLVSNSMHAITKKGVRVGDEESVVLAKYGNHFFRHTFDNLILYEYTYHGPKNQPAILRFAVDEETKKITYISVRFQ